MHEDNRGGVAVEGGFDDFAGVDGGFVDGAFEEVGFVDHVVGLIKKEDFEDFFFAVAEGGGEVGEDGFGVADDVLADDFFAERAPDDFGGGDERGGLGRAEALLLL